MADALTRMREKVLSRGWLGDCSAEGVGKQLISLWREATALAFEYDLGGDES